jgi:hypothetical protein
MIEIIEATVSEIAEANQTHESLWDMFTEKIEEKIGRPLNFFQPFCYTVVGVKDGGTLEIEIEGSEDDE